MRAAFLTVILLAGCPANDQVAYSEVQAVLTDRCTACHAGEFAPEGLELTDAYDELVDVPSAQVPDLDRVAPGDPDASYLWLKLQGRAGDVGGSDSQMPFDGTAPLSQTDLALIEQWILDGAPRE